MTAKLEIVSVALPVFVSVMPCALLLLPTVWLANVKPVGLKLTVAAVAVPVPVRLTVWGLAGALSAIATEAVRLPLAEGVKVMLIVQLAPAATELPQLLV